MSLAFRSLGVTCASCRLQQSRLSCRLRADPSPPFPLRKRIRDKQVTCLNPKEDPLFPGSFAMLPSPGSSLRERALTGHASCSLPSHRLRDLLPPHFRMSAPVAVQVAALSETTASSPGAWQGQDAGHRMTPATSGRGTALHAPCPAAAVGAGLTKSR